MFKYFPMLLLVLALPLSAGELIPGQVTIITAKLTKQEKRAVSGIGRPFPGDVSIAIVVPDGFDPEKTYPMVFTSVTGDRYRPNIEEMEVYWPAASDRGWITITAQGQKWPSRNNDTIYFRKNYYRAAMRVLEEQIPNSKNWPRVFAGFSGGAKMSQYLAAYAVKKKQPVLGILCMGCNQDRSKHARKIFKVTSENFYQISFFFSTGTQDTMSTVKQTREVMESLRKSGATKLKSVQYDGAHIHDRETFGQGLDWFQNEVVDQVEADQ